MDGDALVVAAVVGVEDKRGVREGLVLHHKLLVGPVHVNPNLVLAAHFDAGELGIALAIAHFHGQPMLGVVHNDSRDLGIHHPDSTKLQETNALNARLRIAPRK